MGDAPGPLVVGCAADRGWGLPLAVMLRSAGVRLSPGRTLQVYVVDGGLAQAERTSVEASVSSNTRIEWITPAPGSTTGLPVWRRRRSGATYYRLTIGRLLPEAVSRVLWLDCDILVFEDLALLFDRAIDDDAVVLAAQDPFVEVVSSRYGLADFESLGLAASTPYFNAGVMLIDVAAWRAAEVEDRARAYLERWADRVQFQDQDALNGVLADRWNAIEPRWNWSANRIHCPVESLGAEAPAILHFAGSRKPWLHGGRGPWYDAYLAHIDETSWAGTRPSLGPMSRLAVAYEHSVLRRLTYPLENVRLLARRRLSRARLD